MKIKYNRIYQLLVGVAMLASATATQAQIVNVTHTFPFLKESVDARSAALGGVTATLSNDPNAIYSNPAAAALSLQKGAVAYSFNKVKNSIIDARYQNAVGGFMKINEHHALLLGARYYQTPGVKAIYGNETHSKPYDYSIDLGYSISPIQHLALGATATYAQTTPMAGDATKGILFSLSGLYQLPFLMAHCPMQWSVGAKVANFGMLLNHKEEHLPTVGKLGTSLSATPFKYHTIRAMVDGICYFSPSDHKVTEWAFGVEYTAYKMVALRGGYHIADEENGGYSYATCGIGLAYKQVGMGFSYLFASENTPVEKSWWLSAKILF